MSFGRLSGLALIALLGAGCASAPAGSGERGDRQRIDEPEIAATDLQTAYQVIEALRPTWLRTRGSQSFVDPTPAVASVYVDGQLVGDVEYLRGVRAGDVSSLLFHAPGPAAVRFGMGHPRGVIEVIQKGRVP